MSVPCIPPRREIPVRYTWNSTSVFPSLKAWEAAYGEIAAEVEAFASYRGRLATSPATLADALIARDALEQRLGKLVVYARLSQAVDRGDQASAALQSRAMGLVGQVQGTLSFLGPEILAIGREQVEGWCGEEPRLALYAHYLDELFRREPHLRSAEVEEVLGLLADPFASVETTAGMLTDADLRFAPGRDSRGAPVEVAQGTVDAILDSPDREARRTAWESYCDGYLALKNTLASNLATSVKQSVFLARVRRHPSTLAAALFDNHVPPEVYDNLIRTFRAHLPIWHRYWDVRRRALGVEELHPYDIWAPLSPRTPHVAYEEAVEWIAKALAPLGDEYVRTLRRGSLEERWVDVYPNQGKTGGAFSSGSKGTHPFVIMSYDGSVNSLGTLAHELGHSMHSYLTWQHQPMVYTDYSMFVAEVASNLHQAMVRAYLLEHRPDADFALAVIGEAMGNLHRYLFVMPTLARFELEAHQRLERGEGLSAEDMNALMADLFAEAYGGRMRVDRERVGITWATFGHLYEDYYVYQYATGISAANALSRRILDGEPGAAESYLAFLRAGSSLYPLDALRLAGVDMATPEPVEEAFAVLEGLVGRLERIVGG